MSWRCLVPAAVLVAFCRPGAAQAEGPERTRASEVLAVFSSRCGGCHGPDVARPKGGFGYVLDLRRLRENPDMVVPGNPEQSTLWLLLTNGEMPLPGSPAGMLTAQEKEAVHAWIASGAPEASLEVETPAFEPRQRSVIARLGRLHLLLLHFPIALLFVAAAGECWSACRGSGVSPTMRSCLCLGALSTPPTVLLGWLYSLDGPGAGASGILELHRWLGTTAGLWVLAAALFSEVSIRRGKRNWLVRGLVLVSGLLVALAAHFGGILTHGADFFGR
jgi:mono/diheme cytochrome c family protein